MELFNRLRISADSASISFIRLRSCTKMATILPMAAKRIIYPKRILCRNLISIN